MFRFIILMLATMSLANIAQGACVEEPSARPVVEDSMDIVAEGHHLFGKQKIDLALLADGDIAVKK